MIYFTFDVFVFSRTEPQPKSCPPLGAGHDPIVFTFTDDEPSSDSGTFNLLPLGLLSSEADAPTHCCYTLHRRWSGGGLRALVDSRVLDVLGAFFPNLCCDMCAGSAGMRQLTQSCPFLVTVAKDSPLEWDCPGSPAPDQDSSSSKRYFRSRSENRVFMGNALTWAGRFRELVETSSLKKWYVIFLSFCLSCLKRVSEFVTCITLPDATPEDVKWPNRGVRK